MQLRSQGLNWRDQILWSVTIRLLLNRHSKVLEQQYLVWHGREEQFSVSETTEQVNCSSYVIPSYYLKFPDVFLPQSFL